MRWDLPAHKMALARLALERRLTRNVATGPVIQTLLEAGWVRQSPRRGEVELCGAGETEVRALLETRWPDWERHLESLRSAGLPLTAAGLSQWERARSHEALHPGSLSPRLNQKTLAARFGRHSKTGSMEAFEQRFPQVQVTTDELLRLRTPAGLRLVTGDGSSLECDRLMQVFGEVVLPERALLDGVHLEPAPQAARSVEHPWGVRAVLTVENPAAFVDLPLPSGWLAVLVPGWNSRLALRLLTTLPKEVPILHFGDLDPEGLDIQRSLARGMARPVGWFVPAFWQDYLEVYGLELSIDRRWTVEEGAPLPPLVLTLARTGRWLEQEVIVLDPRLGAAMEAARAALGRPPEGR